MKIQSEQVIKIEFLSESDSAKGYGVTEDLSKTCGYKEMRVYTSLFLLQIHYDSHF